MSPVADSRKQVLERIRAATQGPGAQDCTPLADGPARAYLRRGSLSAEARLELMAERLREYDAAVAECRPEELAATIHAQLNASGRRSFVAPAGLPAEWLRPGFDWKIDGDLPVAEIENADGVVTACSCAIAESGTIALHHGAWEGRRVVSLLPDWHLCIVRADQIVETLPEYFDRFEDSPALVTWISGPSATADIEMTRIRGVHGPRFLNVILVKD